VETSFSAETESRPKVT